MNAGRWLIIVAFIGVLHNSLRALAAILGAQWGFFNYFEPFQAKALSIEMIAEIAGLAAVVAFAGWVCLGLWRQGAMPSASWRSALWGAGVGAALGLLAVFISTVGANSYGLWLFVLVPILMGFVAVIAQSLAGPVSLGEAMITSFLAVVVLGLLLIVCAVEGMLCLVMAVPLAVPLAMAGGALAYALRRRSLAHSPLTFLLMVGLVPFGSTLEHVLPRPTDLFTVTTSIDIPASPDRVWRTVLQPAKLAPPSHILFRAGIAYPLASHIEGAGPTATRYCDFSTGKLVEPVLIWDEGRRLRFIVVSNPLPMQEWTPYAQIHPPHLEGFLASRQGEFRLEPLANGGTRLFATTWYQHHMAPSGYWRLWSDYIIHRVHDMVLANIRERALASPN